MAVGMCLLYKLTDERFGRAIARRTVLFLSISPLAFVFSAVYAESLFLVLVDGHVPARRAAAGSWPPRCSARSAC